MMKYIAGGLAAGLGQGLTEVGRQNGLMKREQFLAQMEDQRAQRDRGWRAEDRQQDREWGQEDRRETRDWQVEDREASQGHDIAMSDRRHGQAVSLQGLSQRHRLALEDVRARRDFERDEINHGRAVALRNLDASLEGKRDRDRSRIGREDAVFQRGLDAFGPGGGRGGAAGAAEGRDTAFTTEVEYLAQSLAATRGHGQPTAQDRLDAAALRRDPTGSDVEKAERLKLRNMLLQESIRSASRMFRSPDMAELLAKANELAGLNPDEPGPEGAAPPAAAPAGLGAGVETVPAAGPAGAQEQPATSPGGLPRPTSLAEVEALPSGTVFMAPDGSVRTKP